MTEQAFLPIQWHGRLKMECVYLNTKFYNLALTFVGAIFVIHFVCCRLKLWKKNIVIWSTINACFSECEFNA